MLVHVRAASSNLKEIVSSVPSRFGDESNSGGGDVTDRSCGSLAQW